MDAQQPPIGEGNVPPPQHTPPPSDYGGYPEGPPPEQQAPQNYPKGKAGIEGLFETQKMVKLIGLGIFFILIGAILFSIALVMPHPQTWDKPYDDNDDGSMDSGEYDDFIRDARSFKAMRNALLTLGLILLSFGVLTLVFMLLGGGIFNMDLDKHAKIGMLFAGSIITASLMYFLSKMMELLPLWLHADLIP